MRIHDPRRLLPCAIALLALACARSSTDRVADAALTYPESRVVDHVDVYHGIEVPDPYRWLEDPDSEETRRWVEAQNELTFAYLEGIPARDSIRERLTELWNYERCGIPIERGGRYFFTRNDGLQNQSVLYVNDSPTAEGRVLLDPNTLSDDGTIALSNYVPSEDGRRLAYGLSDGGSDWRTWKVLDVDTGRTLSDEVRWNKFGGAEWAHDGTGFFYARYDEPEEGAELRQKNAPPDLYFHRLGTPQDEDALVHRRPREEGVSLGFTLTDDGRFMVLVHWQAATRNTEILWAELTSPGEDLAPETLIGGFDGQYRFVGSKGDTFWVSTNVDAPNWKVLAIDRRRPERGGWRVLIPESDQAIDDVQAVGERLLVTYLKDATSEVRIFDLEGRRLGSVDLPGIGTAIGFGGRIDGEEVFYSFRSFTQPSKILRYDVPSGESEAFFTPQVSFDPDDYETTQVFFESRDGTGVPMFITHRRGLERDGSNPTYLYGYGGFNISMTPFFSVSNLVWMEMGGVFAMPNLRGGGEYGEAWHEAGTKLSKQNVFDDFIASAQWLIANGYTSPERLAIGGGSNGGLLVGACMTQRPDLFAAALPAVGVMDMLRFHTFTIGWAWVADYGSSDDRDQFEALYAYSPLHNLREGVDYPATLVTTADHDDRVVPAHSFKFAAALQASHVGSDPVLIRIETRAGHGAGKPTGRRIEEAADRCAFLVDALGMEP